MTNYTNMNNGELIDLKDDEKKDLSLFISESSDETFSVPWRISAIVSEVIEFVRTNERNEKW